MVIVGNVFNHSHAVAHASGKAAWHDDVFRRAAGTAVFDVEMVPMSKQ